MFKATHFSKSFLHVFPTDKENNPNTQNVAQAVPKLRSKQSMDITEKVQKMSQLTMRSQEFSKDILKKLVPEGNKKGAFHVQKKEDLREIAKPEKKKEKSQSPESNVYSYREVENQRLNEVYSKDIIQILRKNEIAKDCRLCLENHKIPSNLRAKMVDWMVEVLSSYKCQDQTFFLAVTIMDQYFKNCKKNLEITDLHLTGVACMFIANKYEEIYPLKLSTIHEKIAHKKLSIEQIKNKELEIMETLNYNLGMATPYEFLTIALNTLNLKNVISKKSYEYLEKVNLYLLKMMMHDYSLMSKQNYYELAAGTVFVAFKIIEQLDTGFPVEGKAKEIREALDVTEEAFYETSSRILTLAKSFEKIYPNFENLKKFNGFALDNEEENKENALI